MMLLIPGGLKATEGPSLAGRRGQFRSHGLRYVAAFLAAGRAYSDAFLRLEVRRLVRMKSGPSG